MWSLGLLTLVLGYAELYTGLGGIVATRNGTTPPKLSDELGLPRLFYGPSAPTDWLASIGIHTGSTTGNAANIKPGPGIIHNSVGR